MRFNSKSKPGLQFLDRTDVAAVADPGDRPLRGRPRDAPPDFGGVGKAVRAFAQGRHLGAVTLFQFLQTLEAVRFIVVMDAIEDQRLLEVGDVELQRHAEPHFPIRGVGQLGIKFAEFVKGGPAENRTGTAYEVVASGQFLEKIAAGENFVFVGHRGGEPAIMPNGQIILDDPRVRIGEPGGGILLERLDFSPQVFRITAE